MQLRNTVVNMRVLQLKYTRRSRRKSTLTFMLKLVAHLFIKRYPWLHATPDFLCYCTLCDCCGEGCREVKCPDCLKDTDLKDYPDKSSSCLKSGKGTCILLPVKTNMHTITSQNKHSLLDTITCAFTEQIALFCERILLVNHAVIVLERVERDTPNENARSCSGTLSLSLSKTPKKS